eukprot:m.68298 g.68298  ORF g.68298 m.68298 type:complete len:50 (-) comp8242_c0_seq1:16-165(-)
MRTGVAPSSNNCLITQAPKKPCPPVTNTRSSTVDIFLFLSHFFFYFQFF